MINEIYIFDDIVLKNIQDELESFVYNGDLIWNEVPNITGVGSFFENDSFPAKVILENEINTEILKLIDVITENTMLKINEKFLQKYRIKINKTFPSEIELKDEHKLLHVDRNESHIVVIYYINDSDGDTLIYEDINDKHLNKLGKKINFENFKLIKNITPKKGRVVVFNGDLWHYGKYPTKGERNVINMNVVIENKNKNKLL